METYSFWAQSRSFLRRCQQRLWHWRQPALQSKSTLKTLLQEAKDKQLIDQDALTMIQGVLQVSEQHVGSVMVPRTQMITVNAHDRVLDCLPAIIESAHSRFPIFGEGRDDVVGLLLAKDVLKITTDANAKDVRVEDLGYPVPFVPESKRLDVLLKEFRTNFNHMAMVVDEYASVVGLVTIEDVLEQIVGDIEDEHYIDDGKDELIRAYNHDQFVVKALTPVVEFNRHFKTNLQSKQVETIGGLVAQSLGHIPKRGESLELGGLEFNILHADKRRVRLLRVSRIAAPAPADA